MRHITFQSEQRSYEILQVLEFDSTRKRMSIILKNVETGQIVLFCKGADTAVISRCVSGNIRGTEASIKMFAHSGWRTLALSYRYLTQAEYEAYENLLINAYSNILERSRLIEKAFEEIESQLILIGSTAIEDKLQEEVAETFEALRKSGIKLWVLTGDKIETAVNISQFCGHFSDEMEKLDLVFSNKQEIKRYLELYSEL